MLLINLLKLLIEKLESLKNTTPPLSKIFLSINLLPLTLLNKNSLFFIILSLLNCPAITPPKPKTKILDKITCLIRKKIIIINYSNV